MWESSAGLHNDDARIAPLRAALIHGPSVVPFVADRPKLNLGAKWRQQLQLCSPRAKTSLSTPRFAAAAAASLKPHETVEVYDFELPAQAYALRRARCVDPVGLAFRNSPTADDFALSHPATSTQGLSLRNSLARAGKLCSLDASNSKTLARGNWPVGCVLLGHAEEVGVEEERGDWVRTARGWLPTILNGRRRLFVFDSPDRQAVLPLPEAERMGAASAENCEAETDVVHVLASILHPAAEMPDIADMSVAHGESDRLSTHGVRYSVAGSRASHHSGKLTPSIGKRIAPGERLISPSVVSESTKSADDWAWINNPAEQLHKQVRWQSLVHGQSYSSWPRVRVPVRDTFLTGFGASWPQTIRKRLVGFIGLGVTVDSLEVVGARSCEEELQRFRERRSITCKPNACAIKSADVAATVPAIDELQSLQWYGELVGVQEQVWVVELALEPSANASNFAKAMSQELRDRLPRDQARLSMTSPTSASPAIWHINDFVPRQVTRVFAWEPEAAPGEAAKPRGMLRNNPALEAPLRALKDKLPANTLAPCPSLGTEPCPTPAEVPAIIVGSVKLVTFGLSNCEEELVRKCIDRGGAADAHFSESELLQALAQKGFPQVDLCIDARCFPDEIIAHRPRSPTMRARQMQDSLTQSQQVADERAEHLTRHIGRHPKIVTRITRHTQFPAFIEDIRQRWERVLAKRISEKKPPDMVVAVYSRTGKHRCVAIAEVLRHIYAASPEVGAVDVQHLSTPNWTVGTCNETCSECNAASGERIESMQLAEQIWRHC